MNTTRAGDGLDWTKLHNLMRARPGSMRTKSAGREHTTNGRLQYNYRRVMPGSDVGRAIDFCSAHLSNRHAHLLDCLTSRASLTVGPTAQRPLGPRRT